MPIEYDSEVLNPLLLKVGDELDRIYTKWGRQDWSDGTGSIQSKAQAAASKVVCDELTKIRQVTFAAILQEEVHEAFAEADEEKLKTELIQVAAVAVQWHAAIERRQVARMEADTGSFTKHLAGEEEQSPPVQIVHTGG